MTLSLFDGTPADPQYEAYCHLDYEFREFHENNPQIWEKFKDITFQTIRRGFKNYSARGICEIIRWHTGVGEDGGMFKINNNYTSGYARMFMIYYPKYDGFFRLREGIHTDKQIKKIMEESNVNQGSSS